MKIITVSGFLGAGKTTFIKELVKRTGREIAILENEVAAINIDAKRLEQSQTQNPDAKINIWEMTEGCICCSAKNDLSLSVLTISNSVDPEYLIIEPTGVGMLGNIISNLQKIAYERISIGPALTIADGIAWQQTLHDYPELFKDQICNASNIIISKLEQKDDKERLAIESNLRTYNNSANILSVPYQSLPDRWFEQLLQEDYSGKVQEGINDLKSLDTFSLKDGSISSPAVLIVFLENILKGHYGNIVRAKGCIKTKDENLRFDFAMGQYAVTGAESDEPIQLVFIGKNIFRQKIREVLLSNSEKVSILNKSKSDKRSNSISYQPINIHLE